MTIEDFETFLDTPITQLRGDVKLPTGTWRLRGKSLSSTDKAMLIVAEPIEPMDDVDPTDLAEWEIEKSDGDAVFIRLRGATPRSQEAQIRRVVQKLGLLKPRDIIGAEFLASVRYDDNKIDPTRPWERWVIVGPVE